MSENIVGLKGGNISGNSNAAKSSFVSGTLGPLAYAEKAFGSMPPEKSVKDINKVNRPQSRPYAEGVIKHDQGRSVAGAENSADNSSGK